MLENVPATTPNVSANAKPSNALPVPQLKIRMISEARIVVPEAWQSPS